MATLTRGSFAHPGSSLSLNTGAWRTQRPEHRPRQAPCAYACPAGENPQAYLAKVGEGNLRAAWEVLVKANPLPAVTGRVCHHPCESSCNRGAYDEPIAIHNVERFLGDRAIAEGWDYPLQAAAANAPEIALVGAGPAGLSAAYQLAAHGCRVVLLDAQPQAGGLLRSALPPYRLPRAVLDAEVERVLATGIDFRPGQRVGRDVSLAELRASFRAVLLAPGTARARPWSVDGAIPDDQRNGLELLEEWISVGALPPYQRVGIVGGGNTAIDLARVIKFNGAAEVHVITFQALPGEAVDTAEVMSATPREIAQAIEEGVIIHDRRGVRRLILRGGTLVGVELVHMRELPGKSGRREPVAFEGTETVLRLDHIIPAIGQMVDPAGFEGIIGHSPFFQCDEAGRLAGVPGLFAGGDACGGSGGSVSAAIGHGRRAALAIVASLAGISDASAGSARPVGPDALNLAYFEHTPRAQAVILTPSQRTVEHEIEGTLSRNQIDHETGRCFSCGACMSCDNCWTYCPDNSVLKVPSSAAATNYVFDYDHCKGCGICANECPVGYIAMVDET